MTSIQTKDELLLALKRCSELKDLETGKSLHSQLRERHLHTNKFFGTALINMYSRCGEMDQAFQAFHDMPHRDVVAWTSLLNGYVDNGESVAGMDVFANMDCKPDSLALVAALKACGSLASKEGIHKLFCLTKGVALHKVARDRGFDKDFLVATNLVAMYRRCGKMTHALAVFVRMNRRDTVSWNILIQGYVENGENLTALELLTAMKTEFQPDAVTLVAALRACVALATERELGEEFVLMKGAEVHRAAKHHGFERDMFVAASLVDMYCKCRRMKLGWDVFHGMTCRDVVVWTSLLNGLVDNGESLVAMDVFTSMDCEPDAFAFVAVLRACESLPLDVHFSLRKGLSIHGLVKTAKLDTNLFVCNALLDLYRKLHSLHHLRATFAGMVRRDVISWNILMLGYVDSGESPVAMDLFRSMDCEPNSATFVVVLKACAQLVWRLEKDFCLETGMKLHRRAKKLGFAEDKPVANTLIAMYSHCESSMLHARAVFDEMLHPDVVSWTCLMNGYLENGEPLVALELFTCMDCEPNSLTLAAAFRACSGLASEGTLHRWFWLETGSRIHLKAVQNQSLPAGSEDDHLAATNSLIDMYGRCGSMRHARAVFDNMSHRSIVSWTTLMLGYVGDGGSSLALELFMSMECEPDSVTYVAALKACSNLASQGNTLFWLEKGVTIHKRARRNGLRMDAFVASHLVEMYSRCGSIPHALSVFAATESESRDVALWNALSLGYVENGESQRALELLTHMDCEPDSVTFIVLVKACGCMGAVELGRRAHAWVYRSGLEGERMLVTCLLDLYCKCSKVVTAEEIFNGMDSPDTVAWNTLMAGYVCVGNRGRVIDLVNSMGEVGLQPNQITFLCILTCCRDAGLAEDGMKYFMFMLKCGIQPSVEHYTCMVSILGRTNQFEKALCIVKEMPNLWANLFETFRF